MDPDEIEQKNRRDALELAKGIYEVVNNPKFKDNFQPDDRHKIIMQKYPNFAQAFPVVLRYIARDLRYNENAFIKFLDKLKADPGKGMDGFMQRQADYAKFLYLEDCKLKGVHWNMKNANEIWNIEYNNMSKNAKKLEKQEKEARNEFEELEKKNLETRKNELLDFINREAPFEPAPEEKKEIDPEILEPTNIILMIRQAKDTRLRLLEDIKDNETIITNISKLLNAPAYIPVEIAAIEEINLKPSDIKDMEKPKLVEILRNINKNITELERISNEVAAKTNAIEKQHQKIREEKDVQESWKKYVDELVNPKKKEKPKKAEKPKLTAEEKAQKQREKEERRKKELAEIESLANNI